MKAKTNDKIGDIVEGRELKGAVLILVNVLYFKGRITHNCNGIYSYRHWNYSQIECTNLYVDGNTTKIKPLVVNPRFRVGLKKKPWG